MELNFTFARQKYLRQLMIHNQRLQFTGIPDLVAAEARRAEVRQMITAILL